MVSLTSWLDPLLGYFAREAGLPVEDYVSQTGGEGIATSIETVTDFFLKGIANKAAQALTGLIVGSYAIWGKPSDRLKKELIAIANHLIMRIIDPSPQQIIEIRKSIDEIIDAIKARDLGRLAEATLRAPTELKDALSALGIDVSAASLTLPKFPQISEIPEAAKKLVEEVKAPKRKLL
ncbi:MAG: hypothetical protein ACTSV7_06740 [Candidatus Baldrarchaeia archaeon]